MNLQRLVLRGFLSHQHTVLELPRRGVVLLCGPNGAGKSSLIEAVSVALWGKTLRGTDPWSGTDKPGVALATHEGLHVERRRRGLSFVLPGGASETYETTGKAQSALERTAGSWEVWRRSCVFSSADAAHFTAATDAERKRLLEEMLGMDRLDAAATAARDAHRQAQRELASAQQWRALLEERARGVVRRAKDATDGLASIPVPLTATQRARLDQLSHQLHTAQADLALLDQAARDARDRALDAARACTAAEVAQRQASGAVCHACGQPYPDAAQRHRAQVAAAEALLAFERAKDLADTSRALCVNQLQVAQADVRRAQGEWEALRASDTAARAAATTRSRLEASIAAAREELLGIEDELEDTDILLARCRQDEAVLLAVVQVLGLRGVRAHLLGQATAGLEAVANLWLGRLAGPDLRLQVRPTTETKAGHLTERLSLEVIGAGGGHGYRAASAGERRRIDVAVLLALGELSAAAHGQPAGTVFLDEVFDALDADGIDRALGVITELAEHRCCVVISHNDDLAQRLRPVERYTLLAGALVAG